MQRRRKRQQASDAYCVGRDREAPAAPWRGEEAIAGFLTRRGTTQIDSQKVATDVSWITRVLASVTLALLSCTPPAAPNPTPPPPSAVPASVAPSPSLSATAAPVPQPSVSPAAVSGSEVKIVEPAFRPPQEWTYSPAEITVKVGTQVAWANTGAVAHTVTADDGTSFDSGSIDPKVSFTFAPSAAGTFAYHCTFHPWMKGTLVVTP